MTEDPYGWSGNIHITDCTYRKHSILWFHEYEDFENICLPPILFTQHWRLHHSEGDQPWDFFGRNVAKAEAPVLWPPHTKSWLIGKDSDAGRDWGQEEKGTTQDEMAGWHHWLDGHESEWTPGVGDGQGGLACCNSWGRKESDMTEPLNWTDGNGCHDLCSLNVLFQASFLTLFFHFHQEALQFLFSFCHKGGVICISEVIDISPGNLDSSLCFPHFSPSEILLISFQQHGVFNRVLLLCNYSGKL